MASRRKKYPLIIYHRLFGAWRVPALLIALIAGTLWWLAPPPADALVPQLGLLTACVAAGLLFLYTVVAPALCYVQCRPDHLLLSTPFYRLAISYRRIHITRPVLFSPANVRWTKQWLVRPLDGHTALAVDLNGYPVEERFLRLWLNEFVLPPDMMGVLLITPDWMALSRDIEAHRGAWKTRQRDAQAEKNPLTSLSSRQY